MKGFDDHLDNYGNPGISVTNCSYCERGARSLCRCTEDCGTGNSPIGYCPRRAVRVYCVHCGTRNLDGDEFRPGEHFCMGAILDYLTGDEPDTSPGRAKSYPRDVYQRVNELVEKFA